MLPISQINSQRKNLLTLVFFICVSLIFFVSFLIRSSDIGISYDWSVPPSLDSFDKTPLTSSWSNGSEVPPGNYNVVRIFYWLLLNCEVSSGLITKLFLILVFAFSAFSMYLLITKMRVPHWIAVGSGIVYMSSSQLFLITHHGYTGYLLGICCVPLLVYWYFQYLEKPTFFAALFVAIIAYVTSCQPQFYAIDTIVLFIISLFHYRSWKSICKLLVVCIVVNLLLSAPWVLIYLSSTQAISSFSHGLMQDSYFGFQQNSIMDLLYLPFVSWSVKDYLQSIHIKWLYDIWAVCQIAVFGIPLIVYGIYRKRIAPAVNKLFLIGFVVLMTGLVLTKGRSEPFGWLGDAFYKLPLSGLFRDINHFYYLITFSAVWLFALAVYVLHANLRQGKRYERTFFGILIAFVLVNASPYLLNVYKSRLHRFTLSEAYSPLIQRLNDDTEDSRVLWLPIGFYVRYNDGAPLYSGINPLVNLVAKEDLGSASDKSALVTKALQFGYCDRITNCTERFLGLYNVRNIINLKKDFSSNATQADRSAYRDERFWTKEYYVSLTKRLKGVTKVESNDTYDAFRLSDAQYLPHLYVPEGLTWVAGNETNILDGIILTSQNRSAYLNDDDGNRERAEQLIVPLEFTEDSGADVSHNQYQLLAKMNVPEDGMYQLAYYQKRRDTTSPGLLYSIKKVDHDAMTIELEKIDGSERQLQQKNPFYSGKVFLRQGRYTMTFSNSINLQNQVFGGSFEYGAWPEPTYNCTSDESQYSVDRSGSREHVLQFHTTKRSVCQTRVVGNIMPHQKYVFSYDVQHIAGELPTVCLKLTDEDYCHGVSTVADKGTWQHKEFVYEQGESERALIHFSVPGSDKMSINNFDNFELRQVGLPETIAFVKEREPASFHVSQVEYRRVNNTEYRVLLRSASGTVPLVFTENYNDNWRAYVASEGPSRSGQAEPHSGTTVQNDALSIDGTNRKLVADHDKVNVYSNIWYIDAGMEPQDIELVIEYAPQRIFRLGQYISLATASLIALYFAAWGVRRMILNRRDPMKRP